MCNTVCDVFMLAITLGFMIYVAVAHLTPIYNHISQITPPDVKLLNHYYMLGIIVLLYMFQFAIVSIIVMRTRMAKLEQPKVLQIIIRENRRMESQKNNYYMPDDAVNIRMPRQTDKYQLLDDDNNGTGLTTSFNKVELKSEVN